jgi:hypothetical protein
VYEHNQVEVPPSFMALYCRHGRPFETRAFIEERFEACDDLAHQLGGFCSEVQAREDLPEGEVLRRCHAGLLSMPDARPGEAGWVVARTAELLEWEIPAWLLQQASAP